MAIDDVRDRLPRFTAELEAGIAAGLHFGGQAYLSQAGVVIADIGFGTSQPDVFVTSEMLMPWMSGSKPLAAVAIGQLFERGLLQFDDRVARFIPEFDQGGKSAITLRHILTHTCGFRGKGRETLGTPWDEIIASICALPLEPGWIPGAKAGYHVASSWFILGEIVRRVDGREYSRYVRDEIFEPLEMGDSWVGMPREKFVDYGLRIGKMWLTERGVAPRLQPWHEEPYCTSCSPGGGGRGPIRELGRFYEALLAGGVGRRGRILQADTVDLLTHPQRVGMFDETFQHQIDWGLGFIVNSSKYGPQTVPYSFGLHASSMAFGHGGFQSSCGMADPAHQLVLAVVLNGTPGEARHSKRIRLLNSAVYEDLGLN
ncbi:MAG: pbpE 2 [Planctomycetaceae bacterium]|nr:pbpE 2 [Planctomycetaceae bacterium]